MDLERRIRRIEEHLGLADLDSEEPNVSHYCICGGEITGDVWADTAGGLFCSEVCMKTDPDSDLDSEEPCKVCGGRGEADTGRGFVPCSCSSDSEEQPTKCIETSRYPNHLGSCDGFGPNGNCSMCSGLIETSKEQPRPQPCPDGTHHFVEDDNKRQCTKCGMVTPTLAEMNLDEEPRLPEPQPQPDGPMIVTFDSREEYEALLADKARLDWLERGRGNISFRAPTNYPDEFRQRNGWSCPARTLRSAIDAARSGDEDDRD